MVAAARSSRSTFWWTRAAAPRGEPCRAFSIATRTGIPEIWAVSASRVAAGEKRTMTYCVGVLVRDGLVMIADTRTNAGLDNIATFRKLHLFETPGDRVIALATSGNLAVSQSVITLVGDG